MASASPLPLSLPRLPPYLSIILPLLLLLLHPSPFAPTTTTTTVAAAAAVVNTTQTASPATTTTTTTTTTASNSDKTLLDTKPTTPKALEDKDNNNNDDNPAKKSTSNLAYVPGSGSGSVVNVDTQLNNNNNNDDDNDDNSTTVTKATTNTKSKSPPSQPSAAASKKGDNDNDDDDDEKYEQDDPRFTMESFITIFVTLCIVLSNCTIIIVAAWTEAFNNFNKVFIYSMSLADLLIGLFVFPYAIFLSVYRRWVFAGGTFCNIEAYVFLTLQGAKLFSLTWLNVDHYIAVRKPERYNVMMSKTRSGCWIIISWLAAICFFMPPMLSFKSSFFNRAIFLCQADTKEQIAYILTSVVLVSMPALLALFVTNVYLFTKSYKKRILFYEKVFVELSTRPWNYHITFVMCAVMCVLWVPFLVLQFFKHVIDDLSVDGRAHFYLCWLGFCCSFSNFVVLMMMCTSFRHAVCDMYSLCDWCPSWCCCCCCKRQTQARYSSDVNVITLTRKR